MHFNSDEKATILTFDSDYLTTEDSRFQDQDQCLRSWFRTPQTQERAHH